MEKSTPRYELYPHQLFSLPHSRIRLLDDYHVELFQDDIRSTVQVHRLVHSSEPSVVSSWETHLNPTGDVSSRVVAFDHHRHAHYSLVGTADGNLKVVRTRRVAYHPEFSWDSREVARLNGPIVFTRFNYVDQALATVVHFDSESYHQRLCVADLACDEGIHKATFHLNAWTDERFYDACFSWLHPAMLITSSSKSMRVFDLRAQTKELNSPVFMTRPPTKLDAHPYRQQYLAAAVDDRVLIFDQRKLVCPVETFHLDFPDDHNIEFTLLQWNRYQSQQLNVCIKGSHEVYHLEFDPPKYEAFKTRCRVKVRPKAEAKDKMLIDDIWHMVVDRDLLHARNLRYKPCDDHLLLNYGQLLDASKEDEDAPYPAVHTAPSTWKIRNDFAFLCNDVNGETIASDEQLQTAIRQILESTLKNIGEEKDKPKLVTLVVAENAEFHLNPSSSLNSSVSLEKRSDASAKKPIIPCLRNASLANLLPVSVEKLLKQHFGLTEDQDIRKIVANAQASWLIKSKFTRPVDHVCLAFYGYSGVITLHLDCNRVPVFCYNQLRSFEEEFDIKAYSNILRTRRESALHTTPGFTLSHIRRRLADIESEKLCSRVMNNFDFLAYLHCLPYVDVAGEKEHIWQKYFDNLMEMRTGFVYKMYEDPSQLIGSGPGDEETWKMTPAHVREFCYIRIDRKNGKTYKFIGIPGMIHLCYLFSPLETSRTRVIRNHFHFKKFSQHHSPCRRQMLDALGRRYAFESPRPKGAGFVEFDQYMDYLAEVLLCGLSHEAIKAVSEASQVLEYETIVGPALSILTDVLRKALITKQAKTKQARAIFLDELETIIRHYEGGTMIPNSTTIIYLYYIRCEFSNDVSVLECSRTIMEHQHVNIEHKLLWAIHLLSDVHMYFSLQIILANTKGLDRLLIVGLTPGSESTHVLGEYGKVTGDWQLVSHLVAAGMMLYDQEEIKMRSGLLMGKMLSVMNRRKREDEAIEAVVEYKMRSMQVQRRKQIARWTYPTHTNMIQILMNNLKSAMSRSVRVMKRKARRVCLLPYPTRKMYFLARARHLMTQYQMTLREIGERRQIAMGKFLRTSPANQQWAMMPRKKHARNPPHQKVTNVLPRMVWLNAGKNTNLAHPMTICGMRRVLWRKKQEDAISIVDGLGGIQDKDQLMEQCQQVVNDSDVTVLKSLSTSLSTSSAQNIRTGDSAVERTVVRRQKGRRREVEERGEGSVQDVLKRLRCVQSAGKPRMVIKDLRPRRHRVNRIDKNALQSEEQRENCGRVYLHASGMPRLKSSFEMRKTWSRMCPRADDKSSRASRSFLNRRWNVILQCSRRKIQKRYVNRTGECWKKWRRGSEPNPALPSVVESKDIAKKMKQLQNPFRYQLSNDVWLEYIPLEVQQGWMKGHPKRKAEAENKRLWVKKHQHMIRRTMRRRQLLAEQPEGLHGRGIELLDCSFAGIKLLLCPRFYSFTPTEFQRNQYREDMRAAVLRYYALLDYERNYVLRQCLEKVLPVRVRPRWDNNPLYTVCSYCKRPLHRKLGPFDYDDIQLKNVDEVVGEAECPELERTRADGGRRGGILSDKLHPMTFYDHHYRYHHYCSGTGVDAGCYVFPSESVVSEIQTTGRSKWIENWPFNAQCEFCKQQKLLKPLKSAMKQPPRTENHMELPRRRYLEPQERESERENENLHKMPRELKLINLLDLTGSSITFPIRRATLGSPSPLSLHFEYHPKGVSSEDNQTSKVARRRIKWKPTSSLYIKAILKSASRVLDADYDVKQQKLTLEKLKEFKGNVTKMDDLALVESGSNGGFVAVDPKMVSARKTTQEIREELKRKEEQRKKWEEKRRQEMATVEDKERMEQERQRKAELEKKKLEREKKRKVERDLDRKARSRRKQQLDEEKKEEDLRMKRSTGKSIEATEPFYLPPQKTNKRQSSKPVPSVPVDDSESDGEVSKKFEHLTNRVLGKVKPVKEKDKKTRINEKVVEIDDVGQRQRFSSARDVARLLEDNERVSYQSERTVPVSKEVYFKNTQRHDGESSSGQQIEPARFPDGEVKESAKECVTEAKGESLTSHEHTRSRGRRVPPAKNNRSSRDNNQQQKLSIRIPADNSPLKTHRDDCESIQKDLPNNKHKQDPMTRIGHLIDASSGNRSAGQRLWAKMVQKVTEPVETELAVMDESVEDEDSFIADPPRRRYHSEQDARASVQLRQKSTRKESGRPFSEPTELLRQLEQDRRKKVAFDRNDDDEMVEDSGTAVSFHTGSVSDETLGSYNPQPARRILRFAYPESSGQTDDETSVESDSYTETDYSTEESGETSLVCLKTILTKSLLISMISEKSEELKTTTVSNDVASARKSLLAMLDLIMIHRQAKENASDPKAMTSKTNVYQSSRNRKKNVHARLGTESEHIVHELPLYKKEYLTKLVVKAQIFEDSRALIGILSLAPITRRPHVLKSLRRVKESATKTKRSMLQNMEVYRTSKRVPSIYVYRNDEYLSNQDGGVPQARYQDDDLMDSAKDTIDSDQPSESKLSLNMDEPTYGDYQMEATPDPMKDLPNTAVVYATLSQVDMGFSRKYTDHCGRPKRFAKSCMRSFVRKTKMRPYRQRCNVPTTFLPDDSMQALVCVFRNNTAALRRIQGMKDSGRQRISTAKWRKIYPHLVSGAAVPQRPVLDTVEEPMNQLLEAQSVNDLIEFVKFPEDKLRQKESFRSSVTFINKCELSGVGDVTTSDDEVNNVFEDFDTGATSPTTLEKVAKLRSDIGYETRDTADGCNFKRRLSIPEENLLKRREQLLGEKRIRSVSAAPMGFEKRDATNSQDKAHISLDQPRTIHHVTGKCHPLAKMAQFRGLLPGMSKPIDPSDVVIDAVKKQTSPTVRFSEVTEVFVRSVTTKKKKRPFLVVEPPHNPRKPTVTLKKKRHECACMHCRRPHVKCYMCLRNKNGVLPPEAFNPCGPIGYKFASCIRCNHGGHIVHIYTWFRKYQYCGVKGCRCRCVLIPRDRRHPVASTRDDEEALPLHVSLEERSKSLNRSGWKFYHTQNGHNIT